MRCSLNLSSHEYLISNLNLVLLSVFGPICIIIGLAFKLCISVTYFQVLSMIRIYASSFPLTFEQHFCWAFTSCGMINSSVLGNIFPDFLSPIWPFCLSRRFLLIKEAFSLLLLHLSRGHLGVTLRCEIPLSIKQPWNSWEWNCEPMSNLMVTGSPWQLKISFKLSITLITFVD